MKGPFNMLKKCHRAINAYGCTLKTYHPLLAKARNFSPARITKRMLPKIEKYLAPECLEEFEKTVLTQMKNLLDFS
jgi:hypothetical protein